MEGGSLRFPLGTDDQGRGILSTILYGLRTSLIVGFSVVVISSVIGIVMGMLGRLLRRPSGCFHHAPGRHRVCLFHHLLAVLLLGVFETRGVFTVIFAICIADWVKYARTIRGSVLEIKDNAYVVAAKSSGAGDFRILFRHILPNALPPIFVVMAVDLAVVIMLEATLSFLGVGCTAHRTVHRHDDRHRQELHLCRHVVADRCFPAVPVHPDRCWWWPSTFFRLAAG
jgi:peptide/nickel transport system permease protein